MVFKEIGKEKPMKNFTLTLLSLSLLGCLAGCGSNKENKNSTTQETTEVTSTESSVSDTSETENEEVTFSNVVKDMYATTTINAYAKPVHKQSVLMSFTVGTPIHITGESEEWYRVEVEQKDEIVVCYIVRHEDCLSADNPQQTINSNVSSGGAKVTVSDNDKNTEKTETKKKKKQSASESSTEKGSADATFSQDEPNTNDEPLVPKKPEVELFDVNDQ